LQSNDHRFPTAIHHRTNAQINRYRPRASLLLEGTVMRILAVFDMQLDRRSANGLDRLEAIAEQLIDLVPPERAEGDLLRTAR